MLCHVSHITYTTLNKYSVSVGINMATGVPVYKLFRFRKKPPNISGSGF